MLAASRNPGVSYVAVVGVEFFISGNGKVFSGGDLFVYFAGERGCGLVKLFNEFVA